MNNDDYLEAPESQPIRKELDFAREHEKRVVTVQRCLGEARLDGI